MIDVDKLPEVKGIKYVEVNELLVDLGCKDRPYFDPHSQEMLQTWMSVHNFGYLSWTDEERPFWRDLVIFKAETLKLAGIVYEDLS